MQKASAEREELAKQEGAWGYIYDHMVIEPNEKFLEEHIKAKSKKKDEIIRLVI